MLQNKTKRGETKRGETKRGGYYINNKHTRRKSKYFKYIAKQQYNNYKKSFSKRKNISLRSYYKPSIV